MGRAQRGDAAVGPPRSAKARRGALRAERVDLSAATRLVDRCIFDGEMVAIAMPPPLAAAALVADLASLPKPPSIQASVETLTTPRVTASLAFSGRPERI